MILSPRSVKRTLVFVAILFAACLCLRAEEGLVRIASYNIKNYLSCDRMVDGFFKENYPKPETEKKALRTIIHDVQPEILALQEMGDQHYLNELIRDLESEGLSFAHSVLMEGADEVRHTAFLSHVPFVYIGKHNNLSFKYFDGSKTVKRGLLEVRIRLNDTSELTIYNLHLKSRWTTRKDDPESEIMRVGEATAVRDFIRERHARDQDPYYLILGDLNDTMGSRTVSRLVDVGDQILSKPVSCFDSRKERWTYFYAREVTYSKIDFFLASPAAYSMIVGEQGTIVDSPEAKTASDHRLIYVDMRQ